MNWSDFYLICFLVGFGLSALALLAGSGAPALSAPAPAPWHPLPARRFGRARRDALVQFRNPRRLPCLVRRHGISAGALLSRLGCGGHLRGHAQRPGRRGGGLLVPGQSADGRRDPARPGRLRHGRRARPHQHFHPRRAAPANWCLRKAARATSPARAAKMAPPSPRAPKSSSPGTKRGSRMCALGRRSGGRARSFKGRA